MSLYFKTPSRYIGMGFCL